MADASAKKKMSTSNNGEKTEIEAKKLPRVAGKKPRRVREVRSTKLSHPSLRRCARRGGVKRLSGLVYDDAEDSLREYLKRVIRDAIEYTECARRRTVTHADVVRALGRNGITYYG